MKYKTDKLISSIKEKDLKAFKKKDLKELVYKIEETYKAELESENNLLRSRLEELEETLNAIRTGAVDAVVVGGSEGDRIFTLSGAEHPYRIMVETMGEGAVTLNSDGLILFANSSFSELLGSPLEKIIGSPINEYITPRDRKEFQARMRPGVRNSRLETELTARDNAKTPVYVSISAMDYEGELGFSVVINDLTHQKNEELVRRHADKLQAEIAERKKAEEKLRNSERRLKVFFESDMVGTMYWNMDGQITDANDKFLRMTGYSREDLKAGLLDWSKMTPPGYEDKDEFALGELEATGSDTPYEKEYIRKDGTRIPIIIGAAMLDDRRHEGVAFVLDISIRKQAEEEMKKWTEQLEAANSELESFSYTLSHDLRAPLRAIDGFSEMLLKETGGRLDPESVRKLNVIRSNTEKMNKFIDDILNYSRTGRAAVSRAAIDMRSLFMEVWKELKEGNPGRSMELKIGNIPPASGDRLLIRQVLSNLLGNAVKFTRIREHAIIEVSGSASKNYNTYSIKDNGVGFDMRYYNKLFEIFRRLHAEKDFEGTGVGLAIVKKIVHKHGGSIWAEGKPGEGAKFCFKLPS
jgi:PAS domain S-box-containing protein